MTVEGVVLDDELAELVRRLGAQGVGGFVVCGPDDADVWHWRRAQTFDVLTHLPTPNGLTPVDELVADVDLLLAEADTAEAHDGALVTAENLRGVASRIMPPELHAAWHAQHPKGP